MKSPSDVSSSSNRFITPSMLDQHTLISSTAHDLVQTSVMDRNHDQSVSSTVFTPQSANVYHREENEQVESRDSMVTSSKDVLNSTNTRKNMKRLPPCKVCGEKASGLHYGVNTCEACKGFFRRSLSRGENFHCAENWCCDIKPGKRNNCAACRYQKCISLGMSKTAIKIGRYTHEKRTRDIIEVNEAESSLTRELQSETSPPEVKFGARTPSTELLHLPLDSSPGPPVKRPCEGLPSVYEQKIGYSLSAAEEVMRYTSTVSQAMMYMKYFFAAKPPSMLGSIIQKRLEERNSEGVRTPDSGVTFIVSGTQRLSVTEERKELIQYWAESIEETFVVIAQFAKSVPGFKTLPLIDRIKLIKGTRSRLLFIASHKRFDITNKCFIGRFNRIDSYDDIVMIYNDSEFVDGMMELAQEFLRIRLNDVEWLLVLAICMCYPDDDLWLTLSKQAKNQLAAMYSQQLRLLDFYLRLNHPHEYQLKNIILTAFTNTLIKDRRHSTLLKEVRAIWEDFYNFPQLFQEIIVRDFRAPLLPRKNPRTKPRSPVPQLYNPLLSVDTINQYACGISANQKLHCNKASNESRPSEASEKVHDNVVESGCKQHWKKSKIAAILETSDHIDELMKQAVKRSKYDVPPHPISPSNPIPKPQAKAAMQTIKMKQPACNTLSACRAVTPAAAASHSLPSDPSSTGQSSLELLESLNYSDQALLPLLNDFYGISEGEPFPETMNSDLDELIPCPMEFSLLNQPSTSNLSSSRATSSPLSHPHSYTPYHLMDSQANQTTSQHNLPNPGANRHPY